MVRGGFSGKGGEADGGQEGDEPRRRVEGRKDPSESEGDEARALRCWERPGAEGGEEAEARELAVRADGEHRFSPRAANCICKLERDKHAHCRSTNTNNNPGDPRRAHPLRTV